MPLRFEWDDEKAASNLRKHGIPFEYAARVLRDAYGCDQEDDWEDYGEERCITVGTLTNGFSSLHTPTAASKPSV